MLLPFYGAKSTAEFQELFTQHLLIAADLVNAAKRQDVVKADDARKRWYQNADDIASFFSSINPFWNEQTWRSIHNHPRDGWPTFSKEDVINTALGTRRGIVAVSTKTGRGDDTVRYGSGKKCDLNSVLMIAYLSISHRPNKI